MTDITEVHTWQQAVDYTFKTRESWRHGNGAATARFNCNHFTRLRGSSFPVAKIRQSVMTQVELELEDEGKHPSTINKIISAVSTALNHCSADDLCPKPPSFRRRKEGEARPFWYTKEEVERMSQLSTDVFDRQDLSDIILFGAYTGMRQGEILRLRVMDIDLITNKINVGGVPTQTTKASNWRTIPIHERIQSIVLGRHSQSTSGAVRIFGDEWRDKDQLIRAFRKVVRLLNKEEEGYTFHTLRHSYATWLAGSGAPLRTIMALCGHKRVETTLRYAKTFDEALEEAMALI